MKTKTITIRSYGSGYWALTVRNAEGGSFGTKRETKSAAIAEAMRSVRAGEDYTMVVDNGRGRVAVEEGRR